MRGVILVLLFAPTFPQTHVSAAPYHSQDALLGNSVVQEGVRFKPFKICDTTDGVQSYSGYVDLSDGKLFYFHTFGQEYDWYLLPTLEPHDILFCF
jgi:hypothetical protein